MASYNVSVPMKLDAFVLNPDVCNQEALLAPITQPNYTFLRIGNFCLQNDIVNPVDVHNAKGAQYNQRVTRVIGSDDPSDLRQNRLGVYLHWVLPQIYRTGAATVPQTSSAQDPTDDSAPVPQYPDTPCRWLVVRKLDPDAPTTKPDSKSRPAGSVLPAVDAWIIESDTIRMIDDLGPSVDLQTDVSPFIGSTSSNLQAPGQTSIDDQAEIFIGKRNQLFQENPPWSESNPPAVNLSLLNSSNQLFPDYQPHNSSVYSMIDTFPYYDAQGNPIGTLTDAVADYYVIGWHGGSNNKDLFTQGSKHGDVLSSLPVTLRDLENFSDWSGSNQNVNTVCHGAMYGVEWHSNWTDSGNAPQNRPANDFSSLLAGDMQAAVGTTPIDALLTYLNAHQAGEGTYQQEIRALGNLLRAQSDSASGQQAGSDEVQNYNFSRTAGGKHWSLPIDDQNPATPPSDGDSKNLRLLNQAQLLYDSAERMLQEKQWETFSLWWKYVTDVDNKDKGTTASYKQLAALLDTARGAFTTILSQQQTAIDELTNTLKLKFPTLKEATLQEYSQQRDPTLFVGGLQTGWPIDFLDSLYVRLDPQISTYGQPDTGGQKAEFYLECLPQGMQATALALVQEFLANSPTSSPAVATRSANTVATYPPLYHDQGPVVQGQPPPPPSTPWRDRWESTQPWFPLFLEWEVEYHHVEWAVENNGVEQFQWSLDEKTAYPDVPTSLRYGLTDAVQYNPLDTRTITGRILLLPQPSFSLQAQLQRLFNSTPQAILQPIVNEDQQKALLLNVTSLPFASAPLDGFTSHLLTLAQGSHLKPNIRVPGGQPVPLQDAVATSQNAGLGLVQLQAMADQTDLTPYGSLVQLGSEEPAFKPCTHGQFRITKLNVIDKFGQTACAIDPKPAISPPPFYPCISEYYEPQMLSTGYANVAIPQPSAGVCDFVQVSPTINQSARLNASFVLHDTVHPQISAYWRPITEWENPVWGWVVVNYVDNGIQFFTQEGIFYSEVRIAAPNNPHPTSAGPAWLPFKPPASSPQTQLDNLIQRLVDPQHGAAYVKAFIDMINNAVPNGATAPGAYSQFVNAVIGKPLALANIGVSLELACDAKSSQTTIDAQDGLIEPWALLPPDPKTSPNTKQYYFPFKLGDHDRLHDGLIAYFEAFDDPAQHQPGQELDTSKFYTTYTDPDGSIVFPISNTDGNKYPVLYPFWLDASEYSDPNASGTSDLGAQQYEDAKNNQLVTNVFGCVMDPFLPVNVYTSILPVKPLILPNWTWENALKNMTAFFHFGPLMVTDDIPANASGKQLTPGYKLTDVPSDAPAVKLPSLKAAEWSWLQPYSPSVFQALNVGQIDSRPRFEKGPYTALEGYLQMKGSMLTNNK